VAGSARRESRIEGDEFIRKRLVGMNPRETIAHKLGDELKATFE
jgi:hypothetical protein